MIITAIISAVLSYIVIGAVLLLDCAVFRKLVSTSGTDPEKTGAGPREEVPVIVSGHSSFRTAA